MNVKTNNVILRKNRLKYVYVIITYMTINKHFTISFNERNIKQNDFETFPNVLTSVYQPFYHQEPLKELFISRGYLLDFKKTRRLFF